ncbi:MAG: hypothetical protein ACR2HF_05965 [Methylococcaceae bacterium]
MEVMPGYKMTEVGVIPEDWESRPLSSIGRFKNGINKGSEAFGHGTPFVNLMDVFGVNSIKSCDGLGLVNTSNAEQETYDLKLGKRTCRNPLERTAISRQPREKQQ